MLTKFKRQDYVSGEVTAQMQASHDSQLKVVKMLLANLLEDLNYETKMSALALELSNLMFFTQHASLPGVTIDP